MRIKIDTIKARYLEDAFEKIKMLEKLGFICDLVSEKSLINCYTITIYRYKRKDDI